MEKTTYFLQSLMGIGTGGNTSNSGERSCIEFIIKNFEEPYCIFDVGANKGQYLELSVKTLKNKKYKIHCFEPGKYTFKQLLKKSDLSNSIYFNNIALGKSSEQLNLYYDNPGSGGASFTKRNLEHFNMNFNQSEVVSVSTLDNYCADNKIEKIDLLKLDVEGHEIDVIEGASNLLSNSRITMIVFEFGGCNIDTKTFFQNYYYFFDKYDMKIFRITPSGYLYPINSYREILEQFRTTNFVAMRL
ncbi:FkbM family methyltransferase [Moorena sp. SIO3B2]|uniref:FkbM family methyltransferase n=1 Tax=Moorena sp. SIO3B2 TaxID=2607827 RepID=UPI00257C2955|nr:FkbM family methyltransferase [Moorena sp. SIO3B2]